MFRPFFVAALLVAIALLAISGCVRRRLTVTSNPPGAMVYVDDRAIGTTPVSTPFTYYGTRKLQAVRDGFETVTTLEPMETPWHQVPPLDFFSENLWPWELRDERVVNFDMVPQRDHPTQEILARAERLRREAHAGYITPLPAPAVSAVRPAPQTAPPSSRAPLPATRGSGAPPPPRPEYIPPPPGRGLLPTP